jgi:hypothetical protein
MMKQISLDYFRVVGNSPKSQESSGSSVKAIVGIVGSFRQETMRLPSSGRLSQECLDFRVEVSGDGEGFRIFVCGQEACHPVI